MMTNFGDRLLLMSYRMTRNNPVQALQTIEQFCGLEPYFSHENVPTSGLTPADGGM